MTVLTVVTVVTPGSAAARCGHEQLHPRPRPQRRLPLQRRAGDQEERFRRVLCWDHLALLSHFTLLSLYCLV